MGRARALAVLGIAAALGLAGPAAAQYGGGPGGGGGSPDAHVDATGNPFLGGLGYDPEQVTVSVGDVVEWTNTDILVPHTATDDHGLWRLSGDYGDPLGLFPKGFGPGESVSREFDGGSFGYFCEVHGRDAQHGFVHVTDIVRVVRRSGQRRLEVRWGAAPLPNGQVFDVQRRVAGDWRFVRDGTSALKGTFPLEGGDFRSRVRKKANPNAASGWSPPAGP